ncbi:MAG: transketolase [Bacteroidales bacterium]|jgi:transketolase|nr:transketolase [Bacteroidales bacterium]
MNKLEKIASQVRRDIIRMVNGAKSGHPGGSLGCADFMTLLFFDILALDPSKFTQQGKDEDMFFLSNGHISPVLYSVLARRGYFPVAELGTFRKLESRLQGHPTPVEQLPGIRVASGSLGQGVSVAIGAAIAKKADNDNRLIYVLTGDGELQEGQMWESFMFAGSKHIDNLIVTVDYNQKQIDGSTDTVCSLGDLKAKFAAFGFTVLEMNGNDLSESKAVLDHAKTLTGEGSPIVILMKTEMGCGVDFMMGTHKWHGNPPNDEQTEIALKQLEETLGDY